MQSHGHGMVTATKLQLHLIWEWQHPCCFAHLNYPIHAGDNILTLHNLLHTQLENRVLLWVKTWLTPQCSSYHSNTGHVLQSPVLTMIWYFWLMCVSYLDSYYCFHSNITNLTRGFSLGTLCSPLQWTFLLPHCCQDWHPLISACTIH